MDPYLERHWLDVHPRLIVESSNQIQEQLGDDLVARIEERIVVEDPTGASRRIGPNVRVVEHGLPGEPVIAAGAAVADPLVFSVESEPFPQRSIEILDLATGGKVITVIEFVSPSNKLPGDARDQYRKKQEDCRSAGVNLVEIDLTRAGRRQLLVHSWVQARDHDSAYQVSVWRAARPSRCEMYPIKLSQPLPAIRIPLRASDPDAVLSLQPLIDTVYVASRYGRTIDYKQPPVPPLDPDDAAFAEQLLKSAGKR
jgi:hypothetical protein